MKRFFVVLTIAVVLLITAVLVLPLVYKDKISQLALRKANQMVDARINYGDFQLTLLRSFPDFTATFYDFSLIGNNQFEADTLLAFSKLTARIDFMSILQKSDVVVKSIVLDNAKFNLIEGIDGAYNWNIESTKNEEDSTAYANENRQISGGENIDQPLKLQLNSVVVNQLDLVYHSRPSDYKFAVYKVDGIMSGEMLGMTTLLTVEANIPSINYNYHDIYYLQNAKMDISTKLDADLEKWVFLFDTESSKINSMPVDIKGGFSLPGDSILFDIDFDVPNIGMQQLMKLIPQYYQQYLTDIETDGTINLNGTINGMYYDEIYPAINIDFDVSKAWLKYPQLPDQLNIHRLKAELKKPEGNLDLITMGISQFDMQLADNPLSMYANFSQLMTDPHLDVSLKGKIDLETLSKVVPLGDTNLKGLLTADASILGNYSALENNNFDEFISSGSVTLKDFFLINSNVPQGVEISNAALVLNNQSIKVNGLQGKIGRSDFSLTGELNNVITYLWANDDLNGQLKWQSLLFDINEFMAAYEPTKQPENKAYVNKNDTLKTNSEVLELPKKVHLIFDANIKQLVYDRMNITNFNGNIELKDQQLLLNGLRMDMIGGQMQMNGNVIADGRPQPDLDFNLDIKDFDLPLAYRQLTLVQKYLPFAAQSQGKFSTKLSVQSSLTDSLKMIVSNLTAKGTFSTKNLKLIDPGMMHHLRSVIQHEKLRNIQVDDFTTHFAIVNGNLDIVPFSTKIARQPVTVGGKYNMGGTLDFRVDATVEKAMLSNQIQSMIAYIPGHQNVNNIDVGFNIKGDSKNPEVVVDNDKIKKQVMQQLKNSSTKELEDAAKKLLRDIFN